MSLPLGWPAAGAVILIGIATLGIRGAGAVADFDDPPPVRDVWDTAPDSAAAAEEVTLGKGLATLLATRPAASGGCATAPVGPLRLPPRPRAAALGILFADGRFARWDSLRVLGTQWYWPLEDACSALGATLLWDPGQLAGEILLDTLRCRFAVGSEMLHCGERVVQLVGRVLYLENHLLLPISFVPRIAAALLPQRWQFDRDSLLLAERPPGPALGRLRIQEVHERTYLRWETASRPEAQLYSDGAGHLIVDLGGLHVDPLDVPAPEARDGACLREVWPGPEGTRFVFAIGEQIVGWRTEWRGDRGEYRVILTAEREDLSGWQAFEPWSAFAVAPAGARGSGPVVLVLPDVSAEGLRDSDAQEQAALRFVHAVGQRLATAWQALGGSVAIVEHLDRGRRSPWSAVANARGGSTCLCLLPDFTAQTVARGYRIVVGSTAPVGRAIRPLTGGGSAPPPGAASSRALGGAPAESGSAEPLPAFRAWPAVSAEYAVESDQLAWMLALHLQAAAPAVPVGRESWPSAALRGLDMPGVVLYVGCRGEADRFPDDEDELTIAQTAEALALALEAFQMRRDTWGP